MFGGYYGSPFTACTGAGATYYWSLLLLVPAFILSAIAQAKVSATYRQYAKIPGARGVTGAQFAYNMLASNHVSGVRIVPIGGELTDHFDPRNETVSLSQGVYDKASVAAVAIAAHECGHVLQYFTNYAPMRMRSALVPIVNVCSNLSMPLIMLGIIFSSFSFLVSVGAWIFFAVVVFQLVTLPVELDASKRALANIAASGVLSPQEQAGAKKVLSAAAMTYLAALVSAFASFLRLLLIARSSQRN